MAGRIKRTRKIVLLIGMLGALAWTIRGQTCSVDVDCMPVVKCQSVAWTCKSTGTTDQPSTTVDPSASKCCEQLDSCSSITDVAGWIKIRVTNVTLSGIDYSAEWLDTFITEANGSDSTSVLSSYVGSWNTLHQTDYDYPTQMFVAELTNSCTIDGVPKWPDWYHVSANVVSSNFLDSTLLAEPRQHKDCLCDINWYCNNSVCTVQTANLTAAGTNLSHTNSDMEDRVNESCRMPVDVETYNASSSLSVGFGPDQAVLGSFNISTTVEGGWAPDLEDQNIWIKARFPKEMTISGITTQGVALNAERRVDKFQISYTNTDGTTSAGVFYAGARLDTELTNNFPVPFRASEVEILIHDPCDPYYIGLRFQFLGCPNCQATSDCIGVYPSAECDVASGICYEVDPTTTLPATTTVLPTTPIATTTTTSASTFPGTTTPAEATTLGPTDITTPGSADTTTTSAQTSSESVSAAAVSPVESETTRLADPPTTRPADPPTTRPADTTTSPQATATSVLTTETTSADTTTKISEAAGVIQSVITDKSITPEISKIISSIIQPNLDEGDSTPRPTIPKDNKTSSVIRTGLSVIRNVTVAANATQDQKLQEAILQGGWNFIIAVADSEVLADVFQNEEENENLFEEYLEVASLILDESTQKAWQQVQEKTEAEPLGIVTAVESVVIQVALSSEGAINKNISKENIDGFITGMSKSEFYGSDFMVTIESSSHSSTTYPEAVVTITEEAFRESESLLDVEDEGTVVVVVLKFSSIQEVFSDDSIQDKTNIEGPTRRLGSEILSISVVSEDNAQGIVTHSLPLTFEIGHDKPLETETPRCTYWLPTMGVRSAGSWLTKGCESSVLSTGVTTRCDCDHMTNFAILMWLGDEPKPVNPITDIITTVGCFVSIVTLAISLALLLYLRSSLTSERIIIHMHLMGVTLIAMVVFLAGSDKTENETVCKFITIGLHFFFMSMFSWMLVEGIHLYRQIVSVFESERSHMWIYFAIGWGIPFLVVGVSSPIFFASYGTNGVCWLIQADNSIWSFIGPIIPTILVNMIVLVKVSRIVMSAAKLQKEKPSFNSVKAGLRSSILLLPILGVTWVLGYFAHYSIILEYTFVTMNAFQGFFMALFHCFLSTEVNNALKQKIKKVKDSSIGGASTMDSSHKPAMFTSGVRNVKVSPATDDTDGY